MTTTNDKEVVSALRAALAGRVGKDRYEVWFGANTQMSVRESTLIISVPSLFFKNWLRSHFRKDLEASCEETFGWSMAIEFRIDPALATPVVDRAPALESSQSRDFANLTPPIVEPGMVGTLRGNGVAGGYRSTSHERPAAANEKAVHRGGRNSANCAPAADFSGSGVCAGVNEAGYSEAGYSEAGANQGVGNPVQAAASPSNVKDGIRLGAAR